MGEKMTLKEIDILIKERYESAKRLAKELWLDGDHEGNDNTFYYFQCGFVAGMNKQVEVLLNEEQKQAIQFFIDDSDSYDRVGLKETKIAADLLRSILQK
jgi:hypothetical protein